MVRLPAWRRRKWSAMEAEMIKGHTHVIRTTADKLAEELDSWLERPDDPDAASSTNYSLTHTGGRDWVIVLRHAEHDEVHPHKRESSVKPVASQKLYTEWLASERSAYWNQCVSARTALKDAGWPEAADESVPSVNLAAGIRWLTELAERKWEPTVSLQAFESLGLVAGEYRDNTVVDDHGVKTPSDIAGWIEDRDRTWIMWIDRAGRPHSLWMQRDESGAVVGNSVNLLPGTLTWTSTYNTTGTASGSNATYFVSSNQVRAEEKVSPWLLLASRETVAWVNVVEGDVLDWNGSVRVVGRISGVGKVSNGVPCVHALLLSEDGGSEFVVRMEVERAVHIVKLDKRDFDLVRRGEFGKISTNKYRGRDSLSVEDPYTVERRLCDADGVVSNVEIEEPNAFQPGVTYLEQLNNLRAHTGLEPVEEPFACTGSAHLAGEHIKCTSKAHEVR